MSATKDGGPAYPAQDWQAKGNHHPGMSLRDWFAGQETLSDIKDDKLSESRLNALAGRPMPLPPATHVLTASDWLAIEQWNADWRARLKFIRADAMLRAREGGAR